MKRKEYRAKESQVQLTAKEVKEISNLFKAFDKDDDYELSFEEIQQVVETLDGGRLAHKIDQQTLKELFDRSDLNKDNKLQLSEFINFVHFIKRRAKMDLVHTKVFSDWKKLDKSGQGRVSVHEARDFILNNFEDLTIREANQIIDKHNTDNDKYLSFQEFCELWNKFRNKF